MIDPPHCGVINTVSGDLLRCGFCDFENDGSFDSGTETQRTDVPFPAYTESDPKVATGEFHRWNGSAWVLVT